MKKRTTILREKLTRPGAIVSAGVYDALSAKLAEITGFEAVHHSGYGTAASMLAKPDVGLLDFSEMCMSLKHISRAVKIPVLGDGDTGYGNALNVDRTVREYIWTGAAGTFLEDQEWPKRCGHMEGKTVIPLEEMMGKLRSAINARNEEDPDFVLIYRTDALGVNGFDDALERARAAMDLGVDMIFIEALESIEQMEIALNKLPVPLMLNLIEGGKTPLISAQDAENMGFKYIVFALSALYAATKGMYDVLKDLRETGTTSSHKEKLVNFQDFAKIVGFEEIRKMEEEYLPSSQILKKYSPLQKEIKN